MDDSQNQYIGLRPFTQDKETLEALYRYTRNAFQSAPPQKELMQFPLPDEPQTETWLRYCDTARELGVFEMLKQYVAPFQFPIKAGISQHQEYKLATLRGQDTKTLSLATGLALQAPDALELLIYQSPAGKIPVIIVPNQADFQSIIRALTARNEPVLVPDSMGAVMINGINNWDRIRRLQKDFLLENPYGNWSQHFKMNIVPQQTLYRDRLIILSKNGYSGVPAHTLQLKEDEWISHSLAIRLEHECAHFFTLRYFGCMANHMHDELIADYMGITKVAGHFRVDWFLHFIGLENYPAYREGGRMQNYLGKPPLSPAAFAALRELIYAAAMQVALFDQSLGTAQTDTERTRRLLTLCQVSLDQMAATSGAAALLESYHTCMETVVGQ